MHPVRLTLLAFLLMLGAPTMPAALAHDGPLSEAPPDERDVWISLGARIHGGFGSLIALGIRIGDDARQRLRALPRELDVTYYNGAQAPCACAADGVMIATVASPGQGTLRVAAAPAAEGQFARVVIRHIKTGQALTYVVTQAVAPKILAANKGTPVERWNVVMTMEESDVFQRTEASGPATNTETRP